jgi:hypothetical protein
MPMTPTGNSLALEGGYEQAPEDIVTGAEVRLGLGLGIRIARYAMAGCICASAPLPAKAIMS